MAAILSDGNHPLKHVQRANIIVLSADRLPVQEVARWAGVSRPAVWRWQVHYAEQGVDGLLRDKTRKPGRAPLSTTTVAMVLALTCSEPPGAGHPLDQSGDGQDGRHQPARRTAHLGGQPPSAASSAHLQTLQRSGLLQALDRTQPGLPLKPGKCGTMTHDYKRNGTTTLFAALNTLTGTVVGRCMPSTPTRSSSSF